MSSDDFADIMIFRFRFRFRRVDGKDSESGVFRKR